MKTNFKQNIMKKAFKNFKQLSAKQIKTYAAVILMSTLSFEAIASATEEAVISETGMIAPVETSFEEELYIENWMHTPFELGIDEAAAMEIPAPAPFEVVLEMELALESWMTLPFETNFVEELPIQNSICTPAP